jgi:hypothetical protein
MNAFAKGLLVGVVQVLLVATIGAKFLYDRSHYPRVWVETAPYDPDLPIRGRYVSVAALVDVQRSPTPKATGKPDESVAFLGRLDVRNGRLLAIEDSGGRHWIVNARCGAAQCWRLTEPLAYFIPESAEDPSRRPAGETLWVEVTVPPKGPPRPVRLGVKKGGRLTPLDLR